MTRLLQKPSDRPQGRHSATPLNACTCPATPWHLAPVVLQASELPTDATLLAVSVQLDVLIGRRERGMA